MTLGEEGTVSRLRALWPSGPGDQNDFDLGFFGRRQLRKEKPNIGGRRIRLSTANDEKISSKSMV